MTTYGFTKYAIGDAVDIEITAGGVSYRLTETLVEPPTGEPPVASDASLSLTESVEVQVNFALYASDPDSAQLKLTAATATNGSLANVVLDTLGTMTADYTPPAHASFTSDTINFTVADAEDNSDSGTLTITVLEEGIQGEIVRTQDYTLIPRTEGEMWWHVFPWLDDANYYSQTHDYYLQKASDPHVSETKLTTAAKFSHPSGIASTQKSIRVNGVKYGNPGDGAEMWYNRYVEGDVVDVVDTVTTGSGIVEELASASITIAANIAPPAFQAGDVTIVDSPSLDGNELKVTINAQRAGSSNTEISHYELSADSTNGTDGTWTRLFNNQMLGARPALVPVAYSGQPWIRQVNRMGSAAPGYQYPSTVTATVGTPVVVVTPIRGDTRPAPAAFMFLAEFFGFSVANPDHELEHKFTYPSEARRIGRRPSSSTISKHTVIESESPGIIGGCWIDPDLVTWGGTSENFTITASGRRKADGPSGTWYDGTTAVTALEPDNHFPTTQTICIYDPANGTPTSGQYPTGARLRTDIDAAFAEGRYDGNVRFLLRRGDTFTVSPDGYKLEGSTGDIYVGAFGSSPTPPLVLTRQFITFRNAITGNQVLWGIDGDNDWSLTTPFVTESEPASFVSFGLNAGADKLCAVFDCKMDGYGTAVDIASGGAIYGIAIIGNEFTSNQNYSTHIPEGNGFLFMTNWVHEPKDAIWQAQGVVAGKTRNKTWEVHRTKRHARRCSRTDVDFAFPQRSFLASIQEINEERTSWQSFPTASQPFLRTGRGRERGQIIWIDELTTNSTFAGGAGESFRPGGAQRITVRNSIFHYETCNSEMIGIGPGDLYENCIFIFPNVYTTNSSNFPDPFATDTALVDYGYWGFWPVDLDQTAKVYSCTFVDLRETAQRTKGSTVVSFKDIVERTRAGADLTFNLDMRNCASIAPHAPSSSTTLEPVSDFDMTSVIAVDKLGVNVADTIVLDDWGDTPSPWPPSVTAYPLYALDEVPIPMPLVGAGLNGDADDASALPPRDIFGTARSTNSRGAVEPAAS